MTETSRKGHEKDNRNSEFINEANVNVSYLHSYNHQTAVTTFIYEREIYKADFIYFNKN